MGRAEHRALVSLGLGEKGCGGNQLSVGNEFMAHRQGMFPRLLDAEGSGEGQRGRWGKGSVLRAELAEWKPWAPLGREHGLPLSSGSECPSQETENYFLNHTLQENAINMLFNILVL